MYFLYFPKDTFLKRFNLYNTVTIRDYDNILPWLFGSLLIRILLTMVYYTHHFIFTAVYAIKHLKNVLKSWLRIYQSYTIVTYTKER